MEYMENEFANNSLNESEIRDTLESADSIDEISYYGQDFDVDGLVRRFQKGSIKIPNFGNNDPDVDSAGFQRNFVWSKAQMDRFIESLLLGYPVPGIFLVRQRDRRMLVLDGQQRLVTLKRFYEGIHNGREFKLQNVAKQFKGESYRSLDGSACRQLDDTPIQATILDASSPSSSMQAIYNIFERLNSGGTQLAAHEIRVALYAGPLVELLESLNQSSGWRRLFGAPAKRLRDQELVLRILAFYLRNGNYRRPLKSFLNKFMDEFQDAQSEELHNAQGLFCKATMFLADTVGSDVIRPSGQVNQALTEALVVAVMRLLNRYPEVDGEVVASRIHTLKEDREFQEAISRSTADEEQVRKRLSRAQEALMGNCDALEA